MADLRDRIRRDEHPFQTVLDWVPGFKGYRERETRREADRLVRQYLVDLLEELQTRLRAQAGALAREARLKPLGLLDGLGKRLEKITDLVRYADSGYTGFFDAAKVKEDDLDRLYEYDVSLKQFVGDLDASLADLLGASEDEMGAKALEVEGALGELEHMVRNREQVATDLVP